MLSLLILLSCSLFCLFLGLGVLLGKSGVNCIFGIYSFFYSLSSFCILFNAFFLNEIEVLYVYFWLGLDLLDLNWGYENNVFNSLMGWFVISVSGIVHIFSMKYMSMDISYIRFFMCISVFTFMMLILVFSSNIIVFFVGWEGVGICSYALVSFWYSRILACKSAMKALCVNKVGDVFFIYSFLGYMFLYMSGSFDVHFICIYYLDTVYYSIAYITLLCLGFLIAVGCKSAQFGFHIWLPDAMEGPTPVSALIHAATMVTTGLILLLKLMTFYEHCCVLLYFVSLWGGFSGIMFGIFGLYQCDIKKIVAYSTCSQLGFMLFSLGCSDFFPSFFHLLSHALFKALLFLVCGSSIHVFYHNQDLRKYGGFVYIVPMISLWLIVGLWSLIGFPLFVGFFSKDLVVQFFYLRYFVSNFLL